MLYKILLFLILNFMGLAIGGKFTGDGVPSEWYQSLNKAPWTPPGWVFGAAWTTVMLCFSIYLGILWKATSNNLLFILLFLLALTLNIVWNPIFFHYHDVFLGLIIISILTIIIAFYLFYYWNDVRYYSLLLLPYLIWLMIATSLNAYVYLNN